MSVALILCGYFYCQGMLRDEGMLFIGAIVVVLEIIGTSLFFESLLPGILTWITGNKRILYRGENITVYNSLAFRINANYKTWTMMSICIATAVTTLTVSITLWYYVTVRGSGELQNYAQVSYGSSLHISALFSYLGPVMAFTILCALGATLYFRTLSDGLEDKKYYDILFKIGMTNDEIKRSVQKQVGISMMAPSFIGIIHAVVAVFLLEDALEVKVIGPLLGAISLFALLYVGFYWITAGKFFRLVSPNSQR